MAATSQKANSQVEAARGRRAERAFSASVRTEYFIREVSQRVRMTMQQRVKLATAFVWNKMITNISSPVTKGTGPRGGRVVTNRSVAGEFPKAETTQLMKTLFMDTKQMGPDDFEGYIGTPLDYGVILELRMDRSFLVRTLNEERDNITRILTGPMK